MTDAITRLGEAKKQTSIVRTDEPLTDQQESELAEALVAIEKVRTELQNR